MDLFGHPLGFYPSAPYHISLPLAGQRVLVVVDRGVACGPAQGFHVITH